MKDGDVIFSVLVGSLLYLLFFHGFINSKPVPQPERRQTPIHESKCVERVMKRMGVLYAESTPEPGKWLIGDKIFDCGGHQRKGKHP